MLLCSHLDPMLTLVELAELAPCALPEAMARVRNMVELGVLELVMEEEPVAVVASPSASPSDDDPDDCPPTGVRPRPAIINPMTATRALLGVVALERRGAAPAVDAVEAHEPRRRTR